MPFRSDALKGDVILLKGVFQILGAFVVENVETGGMSLGCKCFVRRFPGLSNAGSLAIGYGDGVNSIRIVMIQYKNLMIAVARGNGEATCLIGVRFEELGFGEEHDTELVDGWFHWWCEIFISWRRKIGWCFGGA